MLSTRPNARPNSCLWKLLDHYYYQFLLSNVFNQFVSTHFPVIPFTPHYFIDSVLKSLKIKNTIFFVGLKRKQWIHWQKCGTKLQYYRCNRIKLSFDPWICELHSIFAFNFFCLIFDTYFPFVSTIFRLYFLICLKLSFFSHSFIYLNFTPLCVYSFGNSLQII